MRFTPFEKALIEWYSDHALSEEIKNQLACCVPIERTYSGEGFFTELSVQPGSWSRLPGDVKSPLRGPAISSPSLDNGAGSILFLKEGLVSTLEVYTFGDEMSEELVEYEFGIDPA